uniref:Isopenicillin N synthase-like Fe(2+) 2OG dioxygenase domain-containing protein n=1 Tax=Cannabis sativa TaxID=3483 RepID=A0A803RCQ8_CANSA
MWHYLSPSIEPSRWLPSQERWHVVPINPLPNTFIVTLGDLAEIITNGIYQSNEHRALVSSTN